MCHKQNPSLYSNTSQIVAILVALILISKYTLGVSSELLYKYVCNHWKSFCSVCYFHVTNNLIIYDILLLHFIPHTQKPKQTYKKKPHQKKNWESMVALVQAKSCLDHWLQKQQTRTVFAENSHGSRTEFLVRWKRVMKRMDRGEGGKKGEMEMF